VKVFLTGATGFVGGHICGRLIAEGHRVRALVRDRYVAQSKLGPKVELVPGDVVTSGGLEAAMSGCKAVIHLIGIIVESHGATFERQHVAATENLLSAAKAKKVQRWIQMSALGARRDGVSRYQTTKWKAEELVRSSGMEFTILRPSIIFGPGDGFVTQMLDVMRKMPVVRPIPGTGRYPFRPIYIDDVVECFSQALNSDVALNKTIDLVGPQVLTLEEMLNQIADCAGVQKRAMKIPMPLMLLNAALMSWLPKPPVTIDQLRMLREGSNADPKPMMSTFKVNPIGFREGLNNYLCGKTAQSGSTTTGDAPSALGRKG